MAAQVLVKSQLKSPSKILNQSYDRIIKTTIFKK